MSTEAQTFDERTHWDVWDSKLGSEGWSKVGWALPSDPSRYIGFADSYWGDVLTRARTAYGDPNIRFNTDDRYQERYLVFGDGTRLPANGTVVYHDPQSKQNWVQNTDGSVSPSDADGKPTGPAFSPDGYRKTADGKYAPINARGQQVSGLRNDLPPLRPGSSGWHDANGTLTPTNARGDYYEIQPDGSRIFKDANGNPITPEQYSSGPAQPRQQQPPAPTPNPNEKPPVGPDGKPQLQTPAVNIPAGMNTLEYPPWTTEVDPDIPNQMTAVVVRLFDLFGSGAPAQSELPDFPFSTDTGQHSGIDKYEDVKRDFERIEDEFNHAATAFKTAVQNSANVTEKGRDAINDAIDTFNSSVTTLDDGDWDGLLQAEVTLLDTVKAAVQSAAGTQQNVPDNPDAGTPAAPFTPGPSGGSPPATADPALNGQPDKTDKPLDDLLSKLGGGLPLGGMPMGGNPLGGLGGMNPLGGLGGMNPLSGGTGASPLAPLAEGIKPLTKLADQESGKDDKKTSPVTPLNPGSPVSAPPAAATAPAGTESGQPAAAAPAPGAQPDGPKVDPAANTTTKPTVTLPDGKTVEAPNEQAAKAAQNALDNASEGGDAAQKAYSDTGVQLPSDGKNPGAKVDPSDMQPGDVLKWHDKTMVAVAPGLVADPTQPGVTHTLEEVLKNSTGFQGVFRPTEVDPTLTASNPLPPLPDPPQPPPHHDGPPAPAPGNGAPTPTAPPPADAPPDTVPLSGPGPGGNTAPPPEPTPPPPAPPPPSATVPQPAPPSPFESPQPPPATRTTRQQRIAAGQD